jgi:hypothetical protein
MGIGINVSPEDPLCCPEACHVIPGSTAMQVICAEGTCENSRGIHPPEREGKLISYSVLKGRRNITSEAAGGIARASLQDASANIQLRNVSGP